MNRFSIALLSLVLAVAIAAPASAVQLGAGLHYLRTLDDANFGDFSQNDFAILGSVSFPFAVVRVEGDLEWVPDYVGSDEHLWMPSVYGFLDLGLAYGGVGIGWSYLTGDFGGWGSNPWYALRAGVQIGLGGLAVDGFISYQFNSASYGFEWDQVVDDLSLDAFTVGAQVKFGG